MEAKGEEPYNEKPLRDHDSRQPIAGGGEEVV